MLVPLLLLSATSLSPNSGSGHDPSKGASLFRGCQAEVRLMGLGSLEDAPPIDLINGAYCVGYLNGFTAGLPVNPVSICTHERDLGTMIRSYVSYMERNTPLLDEDKRVGLRLALEEAYPCHASR